MITNKIENLNTIIPGFPGIYSITAEMQQQFSGISRLIMLDRYAAKDPTGETLVIGDLVVLTTKPDPQYPARGLGNVIAIQDDIVEIEVEEEFRSALSGEEASTGRVFRPIIEIEKPLELYYEQIAKRVAHGIAKEEQSPKKYAAAFDAFYEQLVSQNLIPAGRVLYGAGTDSQVTYFNCYVMPFIHDSRDGLANHRKEVMEIMSRGGGVGTNGSTLRPRSAIVRGVSGKSSGSVSWLNDLANLTHLVEQGGSRRGAQMIMMADWHPDIFEFILAKMQNPTILRHLIQTTSNATIRRLAEEKLQFTPLNPSEKAALEHLLQSDFAKDEANQTFIAEAKMKLQEGGTYSVTNSEFLSGANISVCLTKNFMDAVEADTTYALRFPAIEQYDETQMTDYDQNWAEIGDVREWEATGRKVKT